MFRGRQKQTPLLYTEVQLGASNSEDTVSSIKAILERAPLKTPMVSVLRNNNNTAPLCFGALGLEIKVVKLCTSLTFYRQSTEEGLHYLQIMVLLLRIITKTQFKYKIIYSKVT